MHFTTPQRNIIRAISKRYCSSIIKASKTGNWPKVYDDDGNEQKVCKLTLYANASDHLKVFHKLRKEPDNLALVINNDNMVSLFRHLSFTYGFMGKEGTKEIWATIDNFNHNKN